MSMNQNTMATCLPPAYVRLVWSCTGTVTAMYGLADVALDGATPVPCTGIAHASVPDAIAGEWITCAPGADMDIEVWFAKTIK